MFGSENLDVPKYYILRLVNLFFGSCRSTYKSIWKICRVIIKVLAFNHITVHAQAFGQAANTDGSTHASVIVA